MEAAGLLTTWIRKWLARRRAPGAGRPPPPVPSLSGYLALGRLPGFRATLDPRLRAAVAQLAAELSGCSWCIERGRHEWRKAGLPQALLRSLPRYDESPLFSPRERAALAFAAALVRHPEAAGGVPEQVLRTARDYFSDSEIAELTALVAGEHFLDPHTQLLGSDLS